MSTSVADSLVLGGHYLVSPTLRRHLLLDHDEWWGDAELCARYDGRVDALPLGETLGQEAERSLRAESQGFRDRDDPPPYFRFTPNMNLRFSHEPDVDHLSIAPLWLAEWQLHLVCLVGEDGCYTAVHHFPNAHGFSHPTFSPGFEGAYSDDELASAVDDDDYSLEIRACELPLRHPLRLLSDVDRHWNLFRAAVHAWRFVSRLTLLVAVHAHPNGHIGRRYIAEAASLGRG